MILTEHEFVGRGCISKLREILHAFHVENILLVRGKNSFEICGAEKVLSQVLLGRNVTAIWDFSENPKIEDVFRLYQHIKSQSIELVLAVGGGSVIDVAKLMVYYLRNDLPSLEQWIPHNESSGPYLPIIAVPTTSGTGSEATQFAVMYVDGHKHSIDHPSIKPTISIVDACFTDNSPRELSATVGLDALSQAIEAHWSIRSTELSRQFSRQAMSTLYRHLARAVENDGQARELVAEAAHLAGKAIQITRTTAPHAYSYALTSMHSLPHGYACALTLPFFLRQNGSVDPRSCRDPRGHLFFQEINQEILDALGASSNDMAAENLLIFIQQLFRGTKVPQPTPALTPRAVDNILSLVNVERLNNHPRDIEVEKLRKYLCDLNVLTA